MSTRFELPPLQGHANEFLRANPTETGYLWDNTPGGAGNVVGPGSSTDNAIVRWDGITGTLIQNSGVILGDVGGGEVTLETIVNTDLNIRTDTVLTLLNSDGGELAEFFNDGGTTQAFPQFFGELDGSAIRIYAVGDDADINIILTTKGAGRVWINDATFSAELDASAIAGSNKVFAFQNVSGTLALLADITVTPTNTVTLTNKRITPRVVSMADATSFTPTGDTADENTQANTQAVGILTANAPSGTPTDGQKLVLRIKSTNIQTFAWNAIYRGSNDLALPATTTGTSRTDYMGFIYNSADLRWDLVAATFGF